MRLAGFQARLLKGGTIKYKRKRRITAIDLTIDRLFAELKTSWQLKALNHATVAEVSRLWDPSWITSRPEDVPKLANAEHLYEARLSRWI